MAYKLVCEIPCSPLYFKKILTLSVTNHIIIKITVWLIGRTHIAVAVKGIVNPTERLLIPYRNCRQKNVYLCLCAGITHANNPSSKTLIRYPCRITFNFGNSYLCDELSKLIFTGALALVGRVT
jgi:hypothetical protein